MPTMQTTMGLKEKPLTLMMAKRSGSQEAARHEVVAVAAEVLVQPEAAVVVGVEVEAVEGPMALRRRHPHHLKCPSKHQLKTRRSPHPTKAIRPRQQLHIEAVANQHELEEPAAVLVILIWWLDATCVWTVQSQRAVVSPYDQRQFNGIEVFLAARAAVVSARPHMVVEEAEAACWAKNSLEDPVVRV